MSTSFPCKPNKTPLRRESPSFHAKSKAQAPYKLKLQSAREMLKTLVRLNHQGMIVIKPKKKARTIEELKIRRRKRRKRHYEARKRRINEEKVKEEEERTRTHDLLSTN